MKQIKFTLSIIFVTVALASCKKNFVCVCSGGVTGGIVSQDEIAASSRKVAEDKCNEKAPNGADFNCTLN